MQNQFGFSLLELLLTLFLGAMVCVGVFQLLIATQKMDQKQMVLTRMQENMRFLNAFLRNNIHIAGSQFCLKKPKIEKMAVISSYNRKKAYDHFKLKIAPGTDLLWMKMCVRLHDHTQYLPVLFFVTNKKEHDRASRSLFFKIKNHPREELLQGVNHFSVHLYAVVRHPHETRAVKIHYQMISSVDKHFTQSMVLYAKNFLY